MTSECYKYFEKTLTHDTPSCDLLRVYKKWAQDYDKDTRKHGYVIVETFSKVLVQFLNEAGLDSNIRIIDLGAGTGLVAESLKRHGYQNIDGLDLSKDMLKIAQDKGLYKKVYCEALGEGTLSVANGAYDLVTSTGTFTYGHVKPAGMEEAINITKSGGIIAFSVRGDVYHSTEFGYKNKISELEERKLWTVLKKEFVDYDREMNEELRKNGFVFICRKN